MTTVTIERVSDKGVKPEGAGWATRSNDYDGPWPLIPGLAYDVEIKPWIGKRDGKEMWFLNSAAPAAEVHAPPPNPTALPPVDAPAAAAVVSMPPLVIPPLPPVERDETRVSIERQQSLRYAAELWNGVEGWSDDAVLNSATRFYDWVSDTSVPPSENVPAEQTPAQQYAGDPGPGQ